MLKPPVVANCPGRVVPANVIWLKGVPRACAFVPAGTTKSTVAPGFRVRVPKVSAVETPTVLPLLEVMIELPAPRVRGPNVAVDVGRGGVGVKEEIAPVQGDRGGGGDPGE